jgi:Concanavalin A-like lectin/glucanases superfamily
MAIVSTYPVSLTYKYGPNVITDNTAFTTSDGMFYNATPFLSAVQDVSFAQNSLNILTSNILLSDNLSGLSPVDESSYITTSTLSLIVGGVANYLFASTSLSSTLTFTSDITQATVFNLQFNNDGTLSIIYDNQYLTVDSTTTLRMEPFNSNTYDVNQSFYYNFHNNQISLFSILDGQVVYNNTNLMLTEYTGFNSTNVFTVDRYTSTYYKELGQTGNVKYVSTTNSISVAEATDDLPHNYLITAPYFTVNSTDNTLGYNITQLKNSYSPDHLQSPVLSAQLRTYNKLYTGLNTENGNDKIYLSYLGSQLTQTFTSDRDTYFHYSVSAVNTPLSASTLVQAGARPDVSPWRSDRLFVKKANYRKYTPWGSYDGIQNGEFFCSWLSASPIGGAPAWMDRYFDPKHVNLVTVLSSAGAGPSNNNYPNVIWDVPSTQVFNPESLYVYHRIGAADNLAIVRSLSGDLTHFIAAWFNPLFDTGANAYAGFTTNLSAANSVVTFPNTRLPALNTALSYASLNLTNNDFYVPGFTLSFQAYNDDWTNFQGDQIVGNYYNGGIGLFKYNPILTPIVSVPGQSVMYTYNNFLAYFASTNTSYVSSGAYVLKGQYTETFYVVDQYYNISEYDQDGVLIAQSVLLSSTNTSQTSAVLGCELIGANLINVNGDRKIQVFVNVNNGINWYRYDTTRTLEASGEQTGVNNYALDLNNNITYYNGIGNNTVDNNNIIWALSGDVLVKGLNTSTHQSVLSALNAEYVACDHENNIWLLYNKNSIAKLDNFGRIIWDQQLPASQAFLDNNNNIREPVRVINFIAELDPASTKLIYNALVVDGITQNLYKVEPLSGTAIITSLTTNVTSPSAFYSSTAVRLNSIPGGDMTGYEYQRKYIYDVNDSKNSLVVRALVENTASLELNSKAVELLYDTSLLTKGWHHFAITVDPYNMLNLYIDGVSAASMSVGPLSGGVYRVFNQRNNPNLVIGTSSFKTQTLAQYIGIPNNPYIFNGYISDVRMYSSALYKSDINALYRSFYTDIFNDLNWSSDTGPRYYIEQIERFFPHRLPGAKSSLYNIRIKNSNITDSGIRNIIEQNIKASLSKTTPVYTSLNKIIWE